VSRIPFFRGKPRAFVADAVAVLTPVLANAGEVVVGRGEVASALYFLVHGTILLHASGLRGARRLGAIRVGAHFGEEGCLLRAQWRAQLSADRSCEMQLIEADQLEALLAHYLEVGDELYSRAVDRLERSSLLEVAPGLGGGPFPFGSAATSGSAATTTAPTPFSPRGAVRARAPAAAPDPAEGAAAGGALPESRPRRSARATALSPPKRAASTTRLAVSKTPYSPRG